MNLQLLEKYLIISSKYKILKHGHVIMQQILLIIYNSKK